MLADMTTRQQFIGGPRVDAASSCPSRAVD
jgi:hypothetical protein